MPSDSLWPEELVHEIAEPAVASRRLQRAWFLLPVLAVAILVATLFLVGLVVDPSAGAAGGCGGG
jgi:hypothetical protein